jgi:hypothetical protein
MKGTRLGTYGAVPSEVVCTKFTYGRLDNWTPTPYGVTTCPVTPIGKWVLGRNQKSGTGHDWTGMGVVQ